MDRRAKAEQGAARNSSKTKGGQSESIFASDVVGGLKVSPKTILITSLLFIASVVILHFIEKLKN